VTIFIKKLKLGIRFSCEDSRNSNCHPGRECLDTKAAKSKIGLREKLHEIPAHQAVKIPFV
jgi:hypothetical protein